jgi:uncharacterized protein (TIGR02284 family)
MNNNKKLIQALNNILQFLYDSSLCFKKHVYNVNDFELKKLFEEYYHSREKMIDEIKIELTKLGADKSVKGTILGKAHMVFENIKSFLTRGNAFAITKEVRRGENVLIDYYKEALKLPLSDSLKTILLSHLNKIETDIKQADLISAR